LNNTPQSAEPDPAIKGEGPGRDSLERPVRSPASEHRPDNKPLSRAVLLAGVPNSKGGEAQSAEDLVQRIQNGDDAVSGAAWQSAETFGAQAVRPLAGLLTHPDFEISRKARRALYRIVHHAGRPGAAHESSAAQVELVSLLGSPTPEVRRQVVWMLSEIAGPDALAPMAALLSDPEVREDARCAVQRVPGKRVSAVLWSAFKQAPEDFKFALADALRQRGEKVKGYPTRKLVPTRPN
jgi:HEAT repeat protein